MTPVFRFRVHLVPNEWGAGCRKVQTRGSTCVFGEGCKPLSPVKAANPINEPVLPSQPCRPYLLGTNCTLFSRYMVHIP